MIELIKNIMKLLSPVFLSILFFFSQSAWSIEQSIYSSGHDKSEKAENSRSDSLDILNFEINLDITDFTNQEIKGHCILTIASLVNGINNVQLDLLELTVDSIIISGNQVPYSYNDTLITVNLPNTINSNDTLDVEVFYHGKPARDASWGGFYFNSGHAFNLGVAFTDEPHNYGRVWFPCFDNFVERSTFTIGVLTSAGKKAHCNGFLVSETTVGVDSVIRVWRIDEEIPSYLACVAVADYETVRWSHNGLNGTIPIEVAALAADTTKVKGSFANLGGAIDAFEYYFGPFLFNKVGYSIVPFNAGAMEHATNIAYPRYAINGNLSNEFLMAHELAHHWWGDLVTCETAGDMWINEGMASYCEHLFTEYIYGKEAYIHVVQSNLESVLRFAHIREQGYRAISGLPHDLTYGMHTYDKGAVVGHNLRTYIGDSLYIEAMTDYLDDRKFMDVSSTDLRDYLSIRTGINMNNFFSDWVFNPGFPHFSIDSISIDGSGPYNIMVHVRQKLKGTTNLFSDVPLDFAFVSEANGQEIRESRNLTGAANSLSFTVPFIPEMIYLNPNNRLNQAVTADNAIISDTGFVELEFGKMNLIVNEFSDTNLIRVEHHWVSPDPIKQSQDNLRMSDYRYWSVDATSEILNTDAEIFFDGRNIQSGGRGHLDYDLLRTGEDSLVLLYRTGPKGDWLEFDDYSVNNRGNISDRFGSIDIVGLKKGEYTLAKGEFVNSIQEIPARDQKFTIYPNPSSGEFKIDFKDIPISSLREIIVHDENGRLLRTDYDLRTGRISLLKHSSGTYTISLKFLDGTLYSQKVVLLKN